MTAAVPNGGASNVRVTASVQRDILGYGIAGMHN